jgi:YfiH family protein
MSTWRIEDSSIGRIVIPPALPPDIGAFYTTVDFPGRIDDGVARELMGVLRERFSIDAVLTTCTQVHGATVTRATRMERWKECDSCDALWTAEKHTALGIKVADCLPVTMLDPAHSVLANVHSGWRGAVQRITAETIDALERETAFDAASAQVYLGPAIRACCFEVGEEVVSEFARSYENIEPWVDRTRAKAHIDVPALTIDLLRRSGFREERIFDSGLCTRCEGSIFHSFRRDGKGGGRNLAIVAQ